MIRALLLLGFWKIKNSLRTILTDPRKLLPFLFLIAFLAFATLFSRWRAGAPPRIDGRMLIDPAYVQVGATLIMVVIAIAVISNSLGDGLLAFAPPDVDYLFPSPIARRLVLAFRMPLLFVSAAFQGLMLVFGIQALGANFPVERGTSPPVAGASTFAMLLCIGIYINLTLVISLLFADRTKFRNGLRAIGLSLAIVLGGSWWLQGFGAMSEILYSSVLRILFYPSMLASEVLFATITYRPFGDQILWLAVGYTATLIPPFLVKTNWYEQSIVSTERVAALRTAARSGSAAVMAHRSATYKHRSTNDYTVKPFGLGPFALFWAHLAAAAKRPYANFVVPVVMGLAIGCVGGFVPDRSFAVILAGLLMFYATFGFMASARTASEAAVRRRELLAPLPLRGWESVAANLGVPALSVLLLTVGFAFAYTVAGGPFWPMVVFGALAAFQVRLMSRMVLQYALVLGFPDVADKLQQFLSQGVYYLLAAPFLIGEVIVCLPAVFLRSIWLGLGTLALYEAGTLAFLLWLVGKASDKAVATGEPVSLYRVAVKRRAS